MPTRAAATSQVLAVPAIEVKTALMVIEGDSPLITNAWSAKAKGEIADKQQGRARPKKAPKVPEDDYQAAFHRLPDGRPGFPTIAFKAAAVDAATQVGGLTKTFLRGAFHIPGDLVAIDGEPHMREDMVRVGMGVADIRYRPEFPSWKVELPVRYNANVINLEQLAHLFNQAGFSVGVGEWRPQRDGQNGMFHVEDVRPFK